MITTAQVAKLLCDEIIKQHGVEFIDNLGDGASIVFMGQCVSVDLFALAEAVLTGMDETQPTDPDLEQAYKEWKSHGTREVEREAPPADNKVGGELG